ncbi:DgyrCDS11072 [Dimorphilus gyrociliatus]|uniref:DgyrCDS11072 n=1 Tax=Dimorphilus gyrociliatus TaxID=2664684 RepID=A0A7I8W447_9ANNE|nr:DgyrCDS11072 [Dimorphilus gyrociliatus]
MTSNDLFPLNRAQDNRIVESDENFSNLDWNDSAIKKIIPVHGSTKYLHTDRRRTWSPYSLEQAIDNAESNLNYMKYFRSDDNIDKVPRNPPVITPVSGRLNADAENISSIIRPIAFKPVVLSPTRRFTSSLQRAETATSFGTHSPSDSGVAADFENLLRERENEIIQLRKTMALNETAILKVYEEKSEHWQKRLEGERSEWQSRLRDISKRARKIEENLTLQIACLKESNINLLAENRQLKNAVRNLQAKLDCNNCDILQLQQDFDIQRNYYPNFNKSGVDFQCQVNLEEENFGILKQEFEKVKDIFEREKHQWIAEKRQVVRYHKCLEMNYKQIQKKNEELTEELAQLAVELENRDLQLLENTV